MARHKKRAGWRRIRAGKTTDEILEGLTIVHQQIAEELQAEARRVSGVMQALVKDLGELREEIVRVKKKQTLEQLDQAAELGPEPEATEATA